MTQDFAKPSTTRAEKNGSKKAKGPAPRRAKKTPPAHSKKSKKPSTSSIKRNSPPKPEHKVTLNSMFKRSTIKIALLSLLIGIATYGLLLLNRVPPSQLITIKHTNKPSAEKKSEIAKPQKTQVEIKKFDFYSQLPKAHITPSKESISHYQPKSKDGEPYLKYLQVGSFRHKKEAEAQKAKIALLGIRAEVKETKTASGTIWYKVETFPFTNRSKLNGAIDKLVNINIEPLEKKVIQ
jgi:hypothetical protein